jgi:hypothetical protein
MCWLSKQALKPPYPPRGPDIRRLGWGKIGAKHDPGSWEKLGLTGISCEIFLGKGLGNPVAREVKVKTPSALVPLSLSLSSHVLDLEFIKIFSK